MSERLKMVFESQPQGITRLVAYLMAGDPDDESSLRRLKGLADAGVDVLELGVPFSDPMADGPVIQAAGERALKGGMTLGRVLELARRFRKDYETPLLIMSYLNPLLHYGWERFIRETSEAGVDGLILPDLPWREGEVLRARAKELVGNRMAFIPLVAQTSESEDILALKEEEESCTETGSFVYVLAKNGITGGEAEIPPTVQRFITELRESIALPRCVGFGIQHKDQVQRLAGIAEGIIVGSALVERFYRIDAKGLQLSNILKAEVEVYSWLADLKTL